MGDLPLEGVDQFLLRYRPAVLERDKGRDDFPPFCRVRHGHGGRFLYLGQGLDGPLHLRRVDVFPGTDDHFLFPADNVDETVLVAPSHVACVEPAAGHGFRRFGGLVPVAQKYIGTTDQDFARLAGGDVPAVIVHDAQFDMEDFLSHGTRLRDGIFQVERGQAQRFRHGVTLDESDPLFLLVLADHIDGDGCTAGDEVVHMREIALPLLRFAISWNMTGTANSS